MNKQTNLLKIVPILLFAVLAVSVLQILYAGAGVYESLTERENSGRIGRTAVQYVTVRLQQAGAGTLAVEEFCGIPSLAVYESIDGTAYCTRIYCHDGYLRELFSAADAEMDPSAGEKLMPMDEFLPSEKDGLLTFTLTADGVSVTSFYDPGIKWKEAAP